MNKKETVIETARELFSKYGYRKVSMDEIAKQSNVTKKTIYTYFKDKNEVKELIGHEVGGVCPFAINEGVTTYLDDSLKRFETVFPACGSSNSAIELTIPELEKYSSYVSWVDVCKNW